MKNVKKMLATSLAGIAAFSVAGIAGAGQASAAECTPLGTYAGGISIAVCIAVDTPPAGYPSVGFYVAPHGYVEVCRNGSCTHRPFDIGPTGAAVVPVNQVNLVPTGGTAVPNICFAGVCTPSTIPGYQVVLFQDSGVVIIQVNDNDTKLDVPTLCVSTTGTC